MKNQKVVNFAILLIALSACSGKAGMGLLKEKEIVYNPITSFFSPIEDYVLHSEFIPDFLNYPNDRVKMGLKGNVKTVEYVTVHKMLLSFYKNGLMSDRAIIYAGSGDDKQAYMCTFSYNDSSRLEQLNEQTRLVSMGGTYANNKIIDKFGEYLPSGKPKTRALYGLNNKKVDYIKQYNYDEKGTCREMTLASDSPNKKNDCMACKITCDEEGKIKTIYVKRTRLLVHRLAAGERTITPMYNEEGRLIATNEVGIPHNMEAYNQDSICCRNDFQYNENGDIIAWKYSDIVYPSNTPNDFDLTFKYEYDNQGNWIKKHIIGEMLHLDYLMNSYYYGKYKVERIPDENNQEKGEIVISRNIVYYESTNNIQQ